MISLPQEVWDEIEDYQDASNFDTISDAVYSLCRFALDNIDLEEEEEEEEE